MRERLWLRWAPWLLLALSTASRRGFTDWEVPWPPSPHSGPAGVKTWFLADPGEARGCSINTSVTD